MTYSSVISLTSIYASGEETHKCQSCRLNIKEPDPVHLLNIRTQTTSLCDNCFAELARKITIHETDKK